MRPGPAAGCCWRARWKSRVVAREGEFYLLRFPGTEDLVDLLERTAACRCRPTSTPPEDADEARYQTVYAREPRRGGRADRRPAFRRGAAGAPAQQAASASPTSRCTSAPAPSSRCASRTSPHHRMHRERYVIPQDTVDAHRRRARARRARRRRRHHQPARAGSRRARKGEHDRRPRRDRHCSSRRASASASSMRCITNFHLPKSTLLMLVSAFAGMENMRRPTPRGGRALPLLQLRRRHADRAAATHMKFDTARHRRRRPPRHADPRPRRRRDAGLHAGRHLRHGQGHGAGRAARRSARRSCSATPSTSGCGPGWR